MMTSDPRHIGLVVPPAGRADQLKARDLAALIIIARPPREQLAMFNMIYGAYRRHLEEIFPIGSRAVINRNCRNFARAVLARISEIEAVGGDYGGRA